MSELSHFNEQGEAHMVDVGRKPVTNRMARAEAVIEMLPATLELIKSGTASKGDVLGIARIAGIMAGKKTSDLIPLCHGLPLDHITIEYSFLDQQHLQIQSRVEISAKTGVEMEALTAVSIAALTIYDMCKAVDRSMSINKIRLLEKSGGNSGHFLVDRV